MIARGKRTVMRGSSILSPARYSMFHACLLARATLPDISSAQATTEAPSSHSSCPTFANASCQAHAIAFIVNLPSGIKAFMNPPTRAKRSRSILA
eukprot:6467708-Amphidinium_carterae.1